MEDGAAQPRFKAFQGELSALRQRPDGPTAPPAAVCGTGSSVARRRAYSSGAPSPAGFGAFALLNGPGLTQFRVSGLQGFGVLGL